MDFVVVRRKREDSFVKSVGAWAFPASGLRLHVGHPFVGHVRPRSPFLFQKVD